MKKRHKKKAIAKYLENRPLTFNEQRYIDNLMPRWVKRFCENLRRATNMLAKALGGLAEHLKEVSPRDLQRL